MTEGPDLTCPHLCFIFFYNPCSTGLFFSIFQAILLYFSALDTCPKSDYNLNYKSDFGHAIYANSEPQPNAKYSCAASVAIAR